MTTYSGLVSLMRETSRAFQAADVHRLPLSVCSSSQNVLYEMIV